MKRLMGLVFAMIGFSAAAAFAQDPYHPGDPGVATPTPIRMEKPTYTDEARNQKIEGAVTLQAVIRADGTVGDIKITKSLDSKYGLGDKAQEAVTHSVFKPGTKDGKPVDVQVNVAVEI